jgi:hypothetical protein
MHYSPQQKEMSSQLHDPAAFTLWQNPQVLVGQKGDRARQRMFWPMKDEVTWNGENYIMRRFIIFNIHLHY